MKVYLVRHGETKWNTKGKLQGWSDVALNEDGVRQAQMTAEGMKDIPFDILFSSPLKRALVTGLIIKGDRDIPVIKDDRLREINFGVMEGRCSRKLRDNPKYTRFFRMVSDPARYRAPKYGENMYQVGERIYDFYQKEVLPLEGKYENVLITAHGGCLHGLIQMIKQQDVSHYWDSPFGCNCSVAIIEVKDGTSTFLTENDVFYETDQKNWSWEVY